MDYTRFGQTDLHVSRIAVGPEIRTHRTEVVLATKGELRKVGDEPAPETV